MPAHTPLTLVAEQARRTQRFFGPEITRYFAFGVAAGVLLFLTELGFAYALQALLVVLGFSSLGSIGLPAWIPAADLGALLVFVAVVIAARASVNWAATYLYGMTGEIVRQQQRARILSWIYRSRSVSTGRAISLFGDKTDALGYAITSAQTLIVQLTVFVLVFIALVQLAPFATLAAFAALGALWPLLRRFKNRIRAIGEAVNTDRQHVIAQITQAMRNLLLLRIYGTTEREYGSGVRRLTRLLQHFRAFYAISGLEFQIPQIIGVGLVCALVLSSRTSWGLPPEVLIAYLYLFVRAVTQFSEVGRGYSAVVMQWPAIADLARWWESVESQVAAPDRAQQDSPAVELDTSRPFGWRLRGVDFGYPGAERTVFAGFDLDVPPGGAFMIVGPSGAGKTTLLELLLGNLDPDIGTVEIVPSSGPPVPLRMARERALRAVGYVGPESYLIDGTIRENLLYGLDRVPAENEIETSLASSECGFVAQLPLQLEHRITEQGQGLSAGQKQRLCLARALLRRPTVLILDEATANLDVETEARLLATLQSFKERMTIVAVTHRGTVLPLADKVLALSENGAVA